jgi:hypothetical protein
MGSRLSLRSAGMTGHMQSLFDKVIAHIQSQNGFRSYGHEEWRALPEKEGDVRHPKYEGDFATTTDASLLLSKGIDVPQEAINLTRISTLRALEKTMPDWAVQEWLAEFLNNASLPQLATQLYELHKESLRFMPTGKRRWYFDYRITGHTPDIKKGGIFTPEDAQQARRQLAEHQPHVVAGVLLWQFALQSYAEEFIAHLKTRPDLSETFKTRLAEFCRFLGRSAFRLASFPALLPMAIVTYARKITEGPLLPEYISPAVADFSARGGFVRHDRLNRIFSFFRNFRIRPPQERAIVCAAKEALVRWVSLPHSLADYISKAEILMKENAEWQQLGEKISAILRAPTRNTMNHLKNYGDGKALAVCPMHFNPLKKQL